MNCPTDCREGPHGRGAVHNLLGVRDLDGVEVVRKEIEEADRKGESWLTISWQRPGSNSPARKLTYVKKAVHAGKAYFIGSGIYVE